MTSDGGTCDNLREKKFLVLVTEYCDQLTWFPMSINNYIITFVLVKHTHTLVPFNTQKLR